MPGKAGGKSTSLTGKKKKGAAKDLDESDIAFKKKQAADRKAEKEMAAKLAGKKKK